jgi:UDP-N-acetylmuramoylalanine--D-glutamate ligase
MGERMQDWRGKRVLVIGAARQGKALTSYLVRHGAFVILNDQRQPEALLPDTDALVKELQGAPGIVDFIFGGHPLSLLEDVDLICPSGGVPQTLPLLLEARTRGLAFSNDSQIFIESAPCTVIGITGSAGKTTTTSIVGRMASAYLQQTGGRAKAYVGGNIGSPLITWLDEMGTQDLAVVELSSFQLELMTASPQIAAVLNITPNHLDRHASMDDYSAAKARILKFQDEAGAAILNREDSGAWSLSNMVNSRLLAFGIHEANDVAGVFVKDGWAVYRNEDVEECLLPLASVGLRGEHNLQNVLAACAVGKAAGFNKESLKAGVEGFTGVAHRLEFVRRWRGVDWYNDSIATAPERSMAAMRSFDDP